MKQIIGLGGGGFTSENSPLLDLYILAATQKKNPKICLLPTASGDDRSLIEYFKRVFTGYSCDTKYLTLMSPRITNMEEFLLDNDVIYVSGGNTKSMLGLWREWGVDKMLVKAYEKGIVLAGVSAGFVCWFEQCVTDSIPNKLTAMDCLGLLKGSGCPHYEEESARQRAYHRLLASDQVSAGYAAADGVGLHFIDGELIRVVSSEPDVAAYRLYKEANGETVEEPIEPIFLGKEENFNKYIMPLLDDSEIEVTDASENEMQ